MDLISLPLFLFVMYGILFAAGQLTIRTTPAVIESTITKSLVVTCSFPTTTLSGYQVFSLAVRKRTTASTFVQLASINRSSPVTVRIDSPSHAINRSNGVIDTARGSSLTLEWSDPKVSESGTYQCRGNVFNQADDIFVFNENKTVKFTTPTVNSLIHRLQELEVEMKNAIQKMEMQTNNKLQKLETDVNNLAALSNQTNNKLQRMETTVNNLAAQSTQTNNKLQRIETDFNNFAAQSTQTNNKLQRMETDFNNFANQSTQTNNKLKRMETDLNNLAAQSTQTNNKLQRMETEFSNLAAQSTQTNNKLQKLETSLHDLKSTHFKKSSLFNGRQYYMSLFQPHSAANAEIACKTLGGYLAEVDSRSEFDFLAYFIGTPIAQRTQFLLGGTDEGHEGRWVNRRSGMSLGYTSWGQGQPDNALYNGVRENCQTITYSDQFILNDFACFNVNGNFGYYFICEVPL